MSRSVYFGPLDAETRWRTGPAPLPTVPDSAAERIVAAMDELLFTLCESEDVLLTAQPLLPAHHEHLQRAGFRFLVPEEAGDLRGLRAEPYAVVPDALETCARLGLDAGHLPALDAVREVNSKLFSNALVEELGLPGAAVVVQDAVALQAEASARLADGGCVVKDPMGVSGRGSIVIRAPSELRSLVAWLGRRTTPFELLVQPLYRRAMDFSCQLHDGEIVGLQVMENDGLRFGAIRAAPENLRSELEREGYFEVMHRVAEVLARRGYRGPACVDSMRLEDGTLVPLLEINARRSMGLFNLHLSRQLGRPTRLLTRDVRLNGAVEIEPVLEALPSGALLLSARALSAGGSRGRLCVALVGDVAESAVKDALAPLGIAVGGRSSDA